MDTVSNDSPDSIARRSAYVAIALVAYAGFHAAFLGMISFLNRGPLPWSPAEPFTDSTVLRVLIDLGWIGLFGAQHAVMARPWFKERWTRIVPAPIERSLFVVATVVCLVAALRFWQPIAGDVFTLEAEWLRVSMFGLQAVGWLTVVVSTFLIDHFELFGLRQVYCAVRGRALPIQRFRTPALYKVSRHPMMLGMVMALWATPDMTWDRLIFAAGFTVYVMIGVRLEERDLVRSLGRDYERYQQEVARFVGWPGRRARMFAAAIVATILFVASGSDPANAQPPAAEVSPAASIDQAVASRSLAA